jgi:N6-L-threonylcarbamoyladenine synthase
MMDEGFDFSFSGIKTAVLYRSHGQDASIGAAGGGRKLGEQELADVAASFQEAVVDVLTAKLVRAAGTAGVKRMVVGGGVAANKRLRLRLADAAKSAGLEVFFPPVSFCTDNAVMVAGLGYHHLKAGRLAGMDLGAQAQVERV